MSNLLDKMASSSRYKVVINPLLKSTIELKSIGKPNFATTSSPKNTKKKASKHYNYEYLVLCVDIAMFSFFFAMLVGGQYYRLHEISGVTMYFYIYPTILLLFSQQLRNGLCAMLTTYINPLYIKDKDVKSKIFYRAFRTNFIGIPFPYTISSFFNEYFKRYLPFSLVGSAILVGLMYISNIFDVTSMIVIAIFFLLSGVFTFWFGRSLWYATYFGAAYMFLEEVVLANANTSWYTSTLRFPGSLQTDASKVLNVINNDISQFFYYTNYDAILLALFPVYPKIETIRQRLRTVLYILIPDLTTVRDGRTSDFTFNKDATTQVAALIFIIVGLSIPFTLFKQGKKLLEVRLVWTIVLTMVISAAVSSLILANLAFTTLVSVDSDFSYSVNYHDVYDVVKASFLVMIISCIALQVVPSEEDSKKRTLWNDYIKDMHSDSPIKTKIVNIPVTHDWENDVQTKVNIVSTKDEDSKPLLGIKTIPPQIILDKPSPIIEFLLSETSFFTLVVTALTTYLVLSGSPIQNIHVTQIPSNSTYPSWAGNNDIEQAFETLLTQASNAFNSNDSKSSIVKVILKSFVTDTGDLILKMTHSLTDNIPCFTIKLPNRIPTFIPPFDIPSIPSISIPDYCFGLKSIIDLASDVAKSVNSISSIQSHEHLYSRNNMHTSGFFGDIGDLASKGSSAVASAASSQADSVTGALSGLADILESQCIHLSKLTSAAGIPMTFVNDYFTTPSFAGLHVDYSYIKLNISLPQVCLGDIIGKAEDKMVSLVETALNFVIDSIFDGLTNSDLVGPLIKALDTAFGEVFKLLKKGVYEIYSTLHDANINIDKIIPPFVYFVPLASVGLMILLTFIAFISKEAKAAVLAVQQTVVTSFAQGIFYGVYIVITIKTILFEYGFEVSVTFNDNAPIYLLTLILLPVTLYQLINYETYADQYDAITESLIDITQKENEKNAKMLENVNDV